MLDLESNLGSIPTEPNILSLDIFHVVKPLMPILALLPISSSFWKTWFSFHFGKLMFDEIDKHTENYLWYNVNTCYIRCSSSQINVCNRYSHGIIQCLWCSSNFLKVSIPWGIKSVRESPRLRRLSMSTEVGSRRGALTRSNVFQYFNISKIWWVLQVSTFCLLLWEVRSIFHNLWSHNFWWKIHKDHFHLGTNSQNH